MSWGRADHAEGTEARFPPEKREEANRLQQEIAGCFRGAARSKSY